MSERAAASTRERIEPQPLWFGRDRARCFGMLHRPAVSSSRGVVFCNPLGFEGVIAYRAYRHLADDLTARGFFVLRFDYDGEGDSAGGPWEPNRVDVWLASIDAAVAVLRARGVTDVRLVGFRMGATLAQMYASTHPGISGLVLWSPCARGAAYLREIRALSRLSALARPPQRVTSEWFPKDSLEVVGFELTAETLRDIAEIDLVAAAGPYPDALVIDRDDISPNDELVRHLVESGSHVDHHRMSGYEDFMTDNEYLSALPWPILHCIEDWLDATNAVGDESAVEKAVETVVESDELTIDDATSGRLTGYRRPGDRVVEETIRIADRYFAVVSRPAGDAPVRRVAIVFANTGTMTRIGSARLHVSLARYWAAMGFTVVRVDLAGCGDTIDDDPETETNPVAPVRIDELHEVLTWVRQWTGMRLVVGGLCSGSYNAFQVATRGLEIDDLFLANPATFYIDAATSGDTGIASAFSLTQGFFNARKWKAAFVDPEARRRGIRSVRKLLEKRALAGLRVLAMETFRNWARRLGLPVKASSRLSRDLEAMNARGVRVLMVFTAGELAARYFHTVGGPACEALLAGEGVRLVDIDGGDHTFSSPAAREALFTVLTNYLEDRYGSAPAGTLADPAPAPAPAEAGPPGQWNGVLQERE
jgi:alpha-beta hydrolase superfamily lysophospholipase